MLDRELTDTVAPPADARLHQTSRPTI